jgi:hypothetical protein
MTGKGHHTAVVERKLVGAPCPNIVSPRCPSVRGQQLAATLMRGAARK